MLIVLFVLGFIAAAISGSDTSRDGFGDELTRLGERSWRTEAVNATVRIAAGIGIVAVAAVTFATLHRRSPVLAALSALVLSASGALVLIANGLQMTLVALADDYVSATGAEQSQLLTTGHTLAVITENVVGMAMVALLSAVAVLAVTLARERMAPRAIAALPAIGVALLASTVIIEATTDGSDWSWPMFMGGILSMAAWLLVAGCFLLASPEEGRSERVHGGRVASAEAS
jgi:uncharacterized membrane protein YqhA